MFFPFQQYPPKKDYVRAVSLLTGYLIQSNGTNCCTLYYLTQVDPRGECFSFASTFLNENVKSCISSNNIGKFCHTFYVHYKYILWPCAVLAH